MQYECTKCGYKDNETEFPKVVICPSCSVGHSPLWRLKKKANDLECPNCAFRGPPDMALMELECPKCGDQYLKSLKEA